MNSPGAHPQRRSRMNPLRWRRTGRVRPGMTLVELMVVLAIVVIMATLAIGVFVTIKTGNDEVARQGQFADLLQQARSSAIYGHGSAKVVMDVQNGKVVAYGVTPVGMWAMEDVDSGVVKGAQGLDGTAIGVTGCPGKYGQAAYFNPQLGVGAMITLPSAPFEIDEGIRMEAWVYCEGDNDSAAFSSMQTIIEKSGAYYLKINPTGTVEAGTPGYFVGSTARLAANTWFKLTAQLDRHEYVLYINDALVGRYQLKPEDLAQMGERTGPLGDCSPGGALTLGTRSGGFRGAMDEVRIWSVTAERDFVLETALEESRLDSNTSPLNAVYFAADGTLDSRFHQAPVHLSYERERMKFEFVISRLGVVEKLPPESTFIDDSPPAGGGN